MGHDAADKQADAIPWERQDAVARSTTLNRILVRIAREALQGESLDALLSGICDCLVAELPVAIASVILLDEAGENFVHEVYAGQLTLLPPTSEGSWPATLGCAGRCVRTGAAQLVADVASDPDYVPGNGDVRSEYLVPIRHQRRMHGVLNLESNRSDFFDVEVCRVFDAVADLVAGAIHFARIASELQVAYRKLEQLSMIDGLTGIANRRSFDEHLRALWRHATEQTRPLALLMVDVDAFKALNDGCGHLYGDECLRALAQSCQRFAETDADLVARYGGEEFVLLLPGREQAQARALAERLRLAVAELALEHPCSPVRPHVTVSIGIGVLQSVDDASPEALIAAADRALYAAKAQGRDRVCV